MKAHVEIHYCPRCKWLARATWYTQELLTTYVNDLERISIIPSCSAGAFSIHINDHVIMDRQTDGFLEAKVLKRRVRDLIAPERSLGHIDPLTMETDS